MSALNLKVLPRDLASKDTRHLLSLIFAQWLPLSTCTVQTVVDVVPPPPRAQRIRVPAMLHPDLARTSAAIEPQNKLERDLFGCESGAAACVVAYVSKMFAVVRKDLPENKRRPVTAQELRDRARQAKLNREAGEKASGAADADTENGAPAPPSVLAPESAPEPAPVDDDATVILAFARLYSGTLRAGDSIYCVLPKYNASLPPTHPRNAGHVVRATVEALYTMMGRDLEAVESVQAGNVFALRGVEGKVWRNATLCAPPGGWKGEVKAEDREWLVNLGGIIRQGSGLCPLFLPELHKLTVSTDTTNRPNCVGACGTRCVAMFLRHVIEVT